MARQGRIMGSGLLRKRDGDSAGATGVTGGGVLRTLTGNGGAWEGSRCAYWCSMGGIAHGSRQRMGLRGHPVCLPVSGWGHCAR